MTREYTFEDPLKIMIVGYGLMGRRRRRAVDLARELHGLPVRVTDICDLEEKDTDGVPFCMLGSAKDRDAAKACDAAMVCVPHDSAEVTTSFLDHHGIKSILVEKPGDSHWATHTGYNYRFLPHVCELLRVVRSGELGAIRSIHGTLGHGGEPALRGSWKVNQGESGGVIHDLGSHLLDLFGCIVGHRKLSEHTDSHCIATAGFWADDFLEDASFALQIGKDCHATGNVSMIRWVNDFRLEVFGEDGYAIASGRGGTYGPMSLRVGRRWGWRSGANQRDTESYQWFNDDDSVELETLAVLCQWLRRPLPPTCPRPLPQPATGYEGGLILSLCNELRG